MKVLTKEEEQAHYNVTVKGGTVGGLLGLGVGSLLVAGAQRRWPTFRGLTLPFRAFLAVSAGTFAAVIAADRASRSYEVSRHQELQEYKTRSATLQQEIEAGKSSAQRMKDWATEHRYPIVFSSWIASMGLAFGIVSRNPYLTGQQKLVQARVYAQGLTIAVLLTSFAFEANDAGKGKGRWETIKVLDPNDPTHKHLIEKRIHHERYQGEDQWMDMVEAEERRMKERAKKAEEAAKSAATTAKDKLSGKA